MAGRARAPPRRHSHAIAAGSQRRKRNLNRRTAGAPDLKVVTSENRLTSRSKLAKLERPRFWGYSEVYCVGVRSARSCH
jgi:hypothetical protein